MANRVGKKFSGSFEEGIINIVKKSWPLEKAVFLIQKFRG
jgi:hypothetical protein